MKEICLGARAFPQPQPAKNPGGDCFACSLKVAVDWLYPEKPIPFDMAWEAWKRQSVGGDPVLSNVWPTLRSAAYAMDGYRLDTHVDLVVPRFDLNNYSHSWLGCIPVTEWAYRLEAWLAAGWIAIADMNLAGGGPMVDGKHNVPDHFVCLDGQRHFWKKHATVEAWGLDHETHVICSARGPRWMHTQDLLWSHGVAGLFLMRRHMEVERDGAGS